MKRLLLWIKYITLLTDNTSIDAYLLSRGTSNGCLCCTCRDYHICYQGAPVMGVCVVHIQCILAAGVIATITSDLGDWHGSFFSDFNKELGWLVIWSEHAWSGKQDWWHERTTVEHMFHTLAFTGSLVPMSKYGHLIPIHSLLSIYCWLLVWQRYFSNCLKGMFKLERM